MKRASWISGLPLAAGLLWFSALPIASADNLVVNGDFEQPLGAPWVLYSGGVSTIERLTDLDPDPDYEVHVDLPGAGAGRLAQIVPVPDSEIGFSGHLRMHAQHTGDAWSGAALVLSYLNSAQEVLGETWLGAWTPNCPWEGGPTTHLIGLPDDVWLDWTFNVNEELVELPAVDPQAVRYIQIELYVQAYEC